MRLILEHSGASGLAYDLSSQNIATGRSASERCTTCPMRSQGFCSLLTDQELSRRVTRRVYQRRTAISDDGEPLRFIYILRSGVLSVARNLSGGRRQVLDFLMGGDSIGLDRSDRTSTTVRVLEDAEVCQLPADLCDLETRSTGFIRGLIGLIEQQLERVHSHIVLLGKLSAEERVVAFLLRYRERQSRLQVLHARVDLPMTRKDIADHLGMAPETVSRVLSWLQDRQLILHIPDGIRIRDLEALTQLQLYKGNPPRDESLPRGSRVVSGSTSIPAISDVY